MLGTKSLRAWCVSVAPVLALSVVAQGQTWTPPPVPDVEPSIPDVSGLDADQNGIDDRIESELSDIRARARTSSPEGARAIQEELDERVAVELVFDRPVTQAQIDAFVAAGGEITHMYRSVSYGWTGTIQRSAVASLPAALGEGLLLVSEAVEVKPFLDRATRSGRVRPVWSNFIGSSDFDGDSNITIAIVDTGIDDSHPDFSGRVAYWNDVTPNNEPSPRDEVQHGSHVAGIAVGSGATFGTGPGTLSFTDSGDYSLVANGSLAPFPIRLPNASSTFTQRTVWEGGGSTSILFGNRANGTSGAFSQEPGTSTVTGSSPLTNSYSFTASTSNHYTAAVLQNGSITQMRSENTVTNFPAATDGFNALSGVCPTCRVGGIKVFRNNGNGTNILTGAGLDDLVTDRIANNLKVANLSLGIVGDPGIDPLTRGKVNTAVDNGIVVVVAAGNDGPGTANSNLIDDPARAAKVITVVSSNDQNQLTEYSNSGFLSPGSDEDHKPDLMAPGGSDFYSHILSVDSNDSDGSTSFDDGVADDYSSKKGTSMAAPFVAGAAALVIDAMQQSGVTWTFSGSAQPLLVKALLCATATESNTNREVSSGSNPTLGRAASPKDRFEGYGMLNPDAAIEAVSIELPSGSVLVTASSLGSVNARRAWARNIELVPGTVVTLNLSSVTADYDLYLYSGTPDAKGNPIILDSNTTVGPTTSQGLSYTASTSETAYLVVKRVSGLGSWTLSGTIVPGPPTPVPTDTPTHTSTPTDTPTSTDTPTPTVTSTATDTPTPTVPTNTPTPVPTTTPTATATPTPLVLATCPAAPGSCAAAQKGVFLLKRNTKSSSRNKLVWKWIRGSVSSQSDFGDPTFGTSYALCVYDDGALAQERSLEPGGTCDGKPCWKPISDKGYKYKNKATNGDGFLVATMKASVDRAKIIFKGKGANVAVPVGDPPFNQTSEVAIQLHRSGDTTCWETVLPPPAKKNELDFFRDKTP